ncbi:MAG: hypothetical protein WC861_04450 [Candidatus Micrarchaeia archaeon]|jgi:hypothetical protein
MNELTFLDLVILKKIDANSSVENFGSAINTSFFETANLLGTVKIKGYVNIETSIGGISKVAITDAGMGILTLAEKKAAEPLEPLDNALLHALAGGAKDPSALQAQLNIRSGDLAYHINKMVVQSFMDYEVRSGKVGLMLTEQGFNSTGGVKVQGAPTSAEVGAQSSRSSTQAPAAQALPAADEAKKDGKAPEGDAAKTEGKNVKEDIFHILHGGDKEEKKPEHRAHHEQANEGAAHHEHAPRKEHEHAHAEKKREEPPAPQSPEEAKRHEHARRMASKLRYYVAEYWAWILLLIIAAVVFAGAVYSMMQKVV